MDKLKGLEIFGAVARSRSFTQAARQLGLSRGYVTKYISWLEDSYGVQLLSRTTRSVGLTHAGAVLLQGARELLDYHEEIQQSLSAGAHEISGRIRVGVPPSFGAIYVAPRVADFVRQYPEVKVELCLDTGKADLAADGLDFSIRLAGELSNSSHVAKLLMRVPQVLVAAPAYLEQTEALEKPADLVRHECLVHTIKAPNGNWSFRHPNGSLETVKVGGSLTSDFGDILLTAALRGDGIAMHHRYMVEQALETGKLKIILAQFQAEEVRIHAIYPTRKRVPLRVRLLLDMLMSKE